MKTKETKNKVQKPKNILYRIVMAVMALCVPIVAYFNELLYIVWDSDALAWLSKLTGNTGDTGETEMGVSIHYVVHDLMPMLKGDGSSSIDFWDTLSPIHTALIVALVFFALAIVCALVVFFISCFSRGWIVGTSVAGGGLASLIGMRIAFSYIAKAVLANEVSLASFLPMDGFAGLFNAVIKLIIFQLSTAFYLMLFLFFGMVIWGVANGLLTLGDKKPKVKMPKETKEVKA